MLNPHKSWQVCTYIAWPDNDSIYLTGHVHEHASVLRHSLRYVIQLLQLFIHYDVMRVHTGVRLASRLVIRLCGARSDLSLRGEGLYVVEILVAVATGFITNGPWTL